MDNEALLSEQDIGQDRVLEESAINEVIVQQEEAQDLIILANSVNSKFIGIEEELDPITRAIRQEILQKQRNILKAYIANNLDVTVDKYDDQEFISYLKNDNHRVIIDQAFADKQVKNELEKVEIFGYKTVHQNFADQFQAIQWQGGDGQHLRTKIIKDNSGKELVTITEITHKTNEIVSLVDGSFKQINSYRTIDLPTELESNSGPMHLSLVLKDENGRNIPKDKAVYFTAHYDNQGQLLEMSSPKPVKFNGEGGEAIGYIEHQGNIYTLPVTQGKYREMILALEKNQGLETNLSQVISIIASDLVGTSKTLNAIDNNIPQRTPEQDKLQYHQEQKTAAEEILQKTSEHYKLAKSNAELISQGLQLAKEKENTDHQQLFEQVAAQFKAIHGLSPKQAITKYQKILDKTSLTLNSRDQEREGLQQLAQQNPDLAEKVVEKHLTNHAIKYQAEQTVNPTSKISQWFKQAIKNCSGYIRLPISLREQQLSALDNIRQQSAQRIKEIDQLMAQVEEADQAANEEIRKLQVVVDKLPESNPNKNKLTEFFKLLAEQEEAIKTGKPLTLSKERNEFLKNHEVRQTSQADNNSCKVTAEQMIDRFSKQDSAFPKEKALAKVNKNCPVPNNTAMILQPLIIPTKVKTSKPQINSR